MRQLETYTLTRFMADGSRYDKRKADYAVAFIQALKHTKGCWSGKPFQLIDWQEQIIRDLFGTVKEDGYRQFTTAYVEIPKKMGKRSSPPQSRSCSPAGMVKNALKCMGARLIVSKHPLCLKSRLT